MLMAKNSTNKFFDCLLVHFACLTSTSSLNFYSISKKIVFYAYSRSSLYENNNICIAAHPWNFRYNVHVNNKQGRISFRKE